MNKIQTILLLLAAALAPMLAPGASAQKKVLGQEAFPGWKVIAAPKISDDGRWISYQLKPAQGADSMTVVYDSRSGRSDTLPRARQAAFFGPTKSPWIAYRVQATHEQLREAKIKKLRRDQMPADTLFIRSLADGRTVSVPNVKNFRTTDQGSVVAYLYEVTPPRDTTDKSAPRPKKFSRLVVWDIRADSTVVDSVENFTLSRNGALVLYSLKGDSLRSVWAMSGGRQTELYRAAEGKIGSLAVDERGGQGAYLLTGDTTSTGAKYQLYYFSAKDMAPQRIAAEGAPNGYVVSEFGRLRFSDEGGRLQFGMAPQPRVLPKDTLPADEKFSLDLWSYTDTLLMTQQLVQARRLREQNYTAAWYPAQKRWMLLGEKYLSRITFADDESAHYALGADDQPYQWASTWESSGKADLYAIDLLSGARRLLEKGIGGRTSLSPSADYVAWYTYDTDEWKATELASGKTISLTSGIPHRLYVQNHDTPNDPRAEGIAGWTADGRAVIYDNFDLWLTDPAGNKAPVCLTGGAGRRDSIAFRYVRLDPEETTIDLSKPLLLSAYSKETKDGGYYRLPKGGGTPQKLIMDDHKYTFVAKAKEADVLLWQRENFYDYRDLWRSSLAFKDIARVSTANPQQSGYKWGSVERISWTALDGSPAEGLLYLPEDYDPSRRYPVIVYFYDTHTDAIHNHVHPQPSWSIVVPAVCTSQDYIVFMPDIHYTTGDPGESCYNYVVSGAQALIDRGIADPARMGLQGQSWGGYQIAYLITRTDMFACASPGAPVSNMTSAFGGIRWGTGMPRMFQYEQGQSRIGKSLWEDRDAYIRNSPLFFADKVVTPTLMRHDDADEAVPWYQGIEYFLALRRMGVPVWMLNYNNEPHNLRSWPAKMDWDKRLSQFQDHYLKRAPMPRWMREGLPVTDKGIDQRYDY